MQDDLNEWDIGRRNLFIPLGLGVVLYIPFIYIVVITPSVVESVFFNTISSGTIFTLVIAFLMFAVGFLFVLTVRMNIISAPVGMSFLRISWVKAKNFPSSRLEELILFFKSTLKGKVEFCEPVVDSSDLDQFLNPAVEFGKVSKKV